MVCDPDEGSLETLTVLLVFNPLRNLLASNYDFDKFLKLDWFTIHNSATGFDARLGFVTERSVTTVTA